MHIRRNENDEGIGDRLDAHSVGTDVKMTSGLSGVVPVDSPSNGILVGLVFKMHQTGLRSASTK